MATHSSILTWRIPWTEAWRAIIHGVTKSQTRLGHSTIGKGSLFNLWHWLPDGENYSESSYQN